MPNLNETALSLFASQIRSPKQILIGNGITSGGLISSDVSLIATFC